MPKCLKTYPLRLTRHEASTLRLAIVAYKEKLDKQAKSCPGQPTAQICSERVDLAELESAYNTQLGVML